MSTKIDVPRVLLLGSGVPGNDKHAGSVIYQELCRHYPRGYLAWFGLVKPEFDRSTKNIGMMSDALAGVPIAVEQISQEAAVYIPDRLLRRFPFLRQLRSLSAFMRHRYLRNFILPRLVAEAVAFGRQQRVELVLAWLSSPTTIYMATMVASKLEVPLVTNIQDPPERIALDHGLDKLTRRILLDEFSYALRSSLRCSTASEGMQNAYRQQYGIDSVVLIHGLDSEQWCPPARYCPNGDFVIGFAGNLYANQEWTALLDALALVDWCIGGRQIRIRVLSPGLNIRSASPMQVEYLGWRSVDETLSLLAQTDVTYLPYWFDQERELFVKQCFPNKLSTYLATGRPVFYHGPEWASVAGFLQRYPAGYSCYSLEPTEIVKGLKKLICDAQYYEDSVQAGQRALKDELNRAVFLERFSILFGIDSNSLTSN